MSLKLQELVNLIKVGVDSMSLPIQGPKYFEYGFGWLPVIIYWVGNRRVLFYRGFSSDLNAEISNRESDPKVVYETNVANLDTSDEEMFEKAWQILKGFLVDGKTAEELPDFEWQHSPGYYDDSIPHPVDKIALVVSLRR